MLRIVQGLDPAELVFHVFIVRVFLAVVLRGVIFVQLIADVFRNS